MSRHLTGLQMNGRLFHWSVMEIRQGKLWPVVLALTLIIACVFALTALAARMEQVIVKQGKDALTADTVFVSANPIPPQVLKQSNAEQLVTAQMIRFGTMAFSDDNKMQLISVKAVDERYPLRGELRLKTDSLVQRHVRPGELWLDERILAQLNVKVGDHLAIGDADFTINGVIEQEPGLSFNPFQQMPSAFISREDVAKTGAVQTGSRVQYQLFINGNEQSIEKLKKSVVLSPSDKWRDKNSASRTSDVFDRTEQYLSLTVAIVIMMAATTLVLTCQHYVSSRRQTIAMLKSLGARKTWIIRWLAIQLMILFISASALGLLVGVGLEYLLRLPLKDMLPTPLPGYGWTPCYTALVTCFLIAVPALGIPFHQLLNISASSVMGQGSLEVKQRKIWLLLLVPIIPLLTVYFDNVLVWMIFVGICVLFVVLGGVSLLITHLLSKVAIHPTLTLALSRINRSGKASSLQFGALALSLMLLAVMWLVRTDLLSDWSKTIPPDAPNAFALNIAPYEKQSYLDALDKAGVERSPAYPITRGRLTEINGIDAKSRAEGREGHDALRREINFTWSSVLPDYNDVIAGKWTPHAGVSVEQDLAEDLGIQIGDTLTFVINSQTLSAQVNTIRHVEWRQMKPNFYFIFSPDVMANMPATWLVSFRLTQHHESLLVQLSRAHPTVSVLDIRTMGAKIESLLRQIVWSITVLAALGVVAGLLLIFTLLRLSLSQRQNEIRLYRTLGASRRRVANTIWLEYGIMALVGGLVASAGAELVVGLMMKYGFNLTPTFHVMLWIALPVVTFAILAVVISSLIRRLLVPINKAFS
ncbi:ABC transporter permease [Vibrio nitrifigilis]|uniref:ABC transporter permease n=1 Tax=Vibrio nitrifigilis TaxID=2789781 RepID=A0ABS0GL61_9VIBR|nr:ABC transporter permease [Vibrio nitrifigilis]MBF9003072.1 ABC transporter permease [Vibrio nitrifigilis]